MENGQALVVLQGIVPPGPEPHQAKLIAMQMLVVLWRALADRRGFPGHSSREIASEQSAPSLTAGPT